MASPLQGALDNKLVTPSYMTTAELRAAKADLNAQLELAKIQKQIREQDLWLPTGQQAADVDIFQTLKKSNEALITVLNRNEAPMYVQQTAATPGDSGGPNYLMYAVLGLVGFFLLRSLKVF